MSKKYMSFLGTSDYKECNYTYGEKSCRTRFVQHAMLEIFCSDFTKGDKVCLFMTKEACSKWWEDEGQKKELFTELEKSGFLKYCRKIIVPQGRNQEELWQIFGRIYAEVEEGDEIIFDITNGFRSLPVFAVPVLNYSHYLKKASLKGLYYGAFEAKDENLNTPIFDLSPAYGLMEWTSAADSFINFGSSSKLCSLTKNTAGTSGRKSRETAENVKSITEILSTVRGKKIVDGEAFDDLKYEVNGLKQSRKYPSVFEPIFDQVIEKTSGFNLNDTHNFLPAAKWYLGCNMIPQGFTILQEGIVTRVLDEGGWDSGDFDLREAVKALFYDIYTGGKSNEKGRKQIESNPDLAAFVRKLEKAEEISSLYYGITEYRNDINHGGFITERKGIDDTNLKKNLQSFYDRAFELFDKKEQ